jgi:enoyl-CoA hydratase/carnithine racemase
MTALAPGHPAHVEPQAEPLLLRESADGIAVLTLNRPKVLNLLSRAMLLALREELAALAADPAVRVLVLAAKGPAFSAGHDLKELSDTPETDVTALFDLCTEVMEGIRLHPKPVIAQVQGIAAAAGCQLVATCDLAVAADTARFGTTGVKVAGLFCGTPMVPVSRAVPAKKALEMLLTGTLISAAEAERAGLVNRVVPADQVAEATMELASQIAGNSPYAVRLGKRAFYRQQGLDFEAAYDVGKGAIVENALAEDGQEGIQAFLEKRPPRYRG